MEQKYISSNLFDGFVNFVYFDFMLDVRIGNKRSDKWTDCYAMIYLFREKNWKFIMNYHNHSL